MPVGEVVFSFAILFCSEDIGSMFHRNIGDIIPHYTV
jgi:hypothetical protein